MEHSCVQCPRKCGVDRAGGERGACGVPWRFRVARASLHMWEEPPISGTRGSGTVFFSGCNLGCVFCQNREISRGEVGDELDADALERLMLELCEKGAHNINLVTPTPWAVQLCEVLRRVKPRLTVPVAYNCGGYESVEILRSLEGLVDIYLPDFKYFSGELAQRFSSARDYFPVALDALREMLRQAPKPVLDGSGMMQSGVILRHLVLPGHRDDSIALLRALAAEFGTDAYLLSLMSQYTPEFAGDCPFRELHRRVTTFEYQSVLDVALELGFHGFFQGRSSASATFTPNFREGREDATRDATRGCF